MAYRSNKHFRDRADIERLYVHQGLLLEEVAARLGVSRPSLSRMMREYGIPIRPKGTQYADLDRRIVKDDETGCWIWLGYRNRHGYGRVTRDKRGYFVHRLKFEERHGPIPDGLEPDHLCNNPPCVNPDHLELVTRSENARRGSLYRWGKRSALRRVATASPMGGRHTEMDGQVRD